MSSNLTRFSKPIIRHLADRNLVVKFDAEGILMRAYRRRKWKRVTWEQIATLADDNEPVLQACEKRDGLRFLAAMGAKITAAEVEAPSRP